MAGALDTIIARVMTEAGTAGAKYSGAGRPAQLRKHREQGGIRWVKFWSFERLAFGPG